MKTKKYLTLLLAATTLQMMAAVNHMPENGFYSEQPAQTWEQYLVSGNGIQGIMVAGRPDDETIVLNHTNLFLPVHEPFTPPSQGNHLRKIQQMMLDGKYDEASRFMVDISHADGFGNKRHSDLFVPAFKLSLQEKTLPYSDYSRSVDFATGEIRVCWTDKRGKFMRRSFVSRRDNVAVTEISAEKGRVNLVLDLALIDTFDPKRKVKFALNDSLNIKRYEKGVFLDQLTGRVWYATPWKGGYSGYEGMVRVVREGGAAKVKDGKLVISGAKSVTLLSEVAPVKTMDQTPAELFGSRLQQLSADYSTLLSRHIPLHAGLMNRVSLRLNGDTSSSTALSSEALLAKGGADDRVVERLFNAARYNIISATGINPPNLQGIWSATMTPPWAGDYTTNGNLPTAVSHYLAANTPELMLSLFDKLESQMDYYRTNARILFKCRGIHIPSHVCLQGYDNEFDATWPMTFWTAGAAWYSLFYYDYYLYTLDERFLRERALPFMTEAAAFYEDFLIRGADGKWVFNPSYSPENHPGNSKSQACVNATMDIAVAKALLRDLLAASRQLGVNGDKIPVWEKMLADMPAYALNSDGELREWTWRDLSDNHQHRHASHLIGLYYRHDPEIMSNPALVEGVRRAIHSRLDYRRTDKNGGVMAFGLSQLAFPTCAVGDGETAFEMLKMAGENYFNNNLMTTHDPHKIFNTDMSGAYPTIVMDMLAYSDLGQITLLPACPKAWRSGEICGMALRGGIHCDRLAWKDGKCSVTLTSKIDQTVQVQVGYQGEWHKVELKAGSARTFNL